MTDDARRFWDCEAMVRRHRREAIVIRLDDPALWGVIDDEGDALVNCR